VSFIDLAQPIIGNQWWTAAATFEEEKRRKKNNKKRREKKIDWFDFGIVSRNKEEIFFFTH